VASERFAWLKAVMLDDTGAANDGEAEVTATAPMIATATASVIVCFFILLSFHS
jgi:hypothetical protein